jgi:hypothetical protein
VRREFRGKSIVAEDINGNTSGYEPEDFELADKERQILPNEKD